MRAAFPPFSVGDFVAHRTARYWSWWPPWPMICGAFFEPHTGWGSLLLDSKRLTKRTANAYHPGSVPAWFVSAWLLPMVPYALERFAVSITQNKQLIRVGHSPDPDDAFMFHALANEHLDTGNYKFTHELVDIETLNQRAFSGELELTAISIHAYAFLHDKYALCSCGASMGDGYGPMVVSREACQVDDLKSKRIAIPGKLTSAFLGLRMCLGQEFSFVEVPFDEIIPAVVRGDYQGQPVDAGLIIHEGQLTYSDQDLKLVVDLGVWWQNLTNGLPLPLGANAIRKDLGKETIHEVQQYLHASIKYGLDHREEALAYALQYGRDLDQSKADKFVGMYVNDWTLDFGEKGREAVTRFLAMGHEQGILPEPIVPEFVGV